MRRTALALMLAFALSEGGLAAVEPLSSSRARHVTEVAAARPGDAATNPRAALAIVPALTVAGVAVQKKDVRPACRAEPGRQAERLRGTVNAGEEVVRTTPSGWVVRLWPTAQGWLLQIGSRGRESEDLARLTPPWHFVPNPRQIEGWHFRNADNTGPNDGSVNAPQALREFIFSPAVGREIEYSSSERTAEAVERVRSYGRGWIHLESYRLTPPRRGARAAFETMTFVACLTWPG